MRTRIRLFATAIVTFGAGVYVLVGMHAIHPEFGFVLMGIGGVLFLLALVLGGRGRNMPVNQTLPYGGYPPQMPYPPQQYPLQTPYPPQQYPLQTPYPQYPYPVRRRTNPWIIWLIGTVIIAVIGAIATVVLPAIIVYGPHSNGSVNTTSSTSNSFNSSYQPVDGIPCDSSEQLAYHIHAHLSIYINGQPIAIPQFIGIASDQSCYYWVHTHDTSGVIHIEVPSNQKYTLGNFLDIWKLHFADLGTGFPSQLSQPGWAIFINGRASHTDLRMIQLSSHELITLAYNSSGIQPDTIYNWGDL